MTVYQLFELANYISGRHPQGTAITPARFNVLLPQCQMEWYDTLWRGLLAASPDNNRLGDIISQTPLTVFKDTAVLTLDAAGVSALPLDYSACLAVTTVAEYTGNTGVVRPRMVDIVTDSKFRKKQNSILSRTANPFGRIIGRSIQVSPNNINDITLDYLAIPTTPYMDYCSRTANPSSVVNMPVGSYINLSNGLYYLYDSNNNVIESDVIKDVSHLLPYNSATAELQWLEKDHYNLLYRILVKTGLNLKEDDVTKVAMAYTQAQ